MIKVFIFDPLWSRLATKELLTNLRNAEVELIVTEAIAPLAKCAALFTGAEPRILAINPDYVSWKLSSEDYKAIPNLTAIIGAASSYSWIDSTYADANRIPVCNIRNFSTEAVAEWAITMMFNVARQVPRLVKAEFPLDFDKDFMEYRGIELHGKRAGIIGLGHIGGAIAQRCAALGMQVSYWSKSPKSSPYAKSELGTLFAESDVIFPTLVDSAETRRVISRELLRSMKASSLLISVVHNLFDETLVLDMVAKRQLFGFGFEAKPASFSKFEGNVWAAPAYAWVTDGSMNNAMTKWVQCIIGAAQGSFPTRVN